MDVDWYIINIILEHVLPYAGFIGCNYNTFVLKHQNGQAHVAEPGIWRIKNVGNQLIRMGPIDL